jgi:hypothetical protein
MPNARFETGASEPRRLTYRRAALVLALALLVASTVSTITAHAGEPHTRAHAARALNVTDTAHLRYVRESGSALLDEGAVSGALPGTVKVRFNVGVTVTASFTIYARNGSLTGHGSGALHESHSSSHDAYVSFGGTMTIIHGTGRYAHAHGGGGFYGVINRETYAATIQTTGTLAY